MGDNKSMPSVGAWATNTINWAEFNKSNKKMEFTKEELSLIQDALNAYYHQNRKITEDKEAGYLEARQAMSIKTQCKDLMDKID